MPVILNGHGIAVNFEGLTEFMAADQPSILEGDHNEHHLGQDGTV